MCNYLDGLFALSSKNRLDWFNTIFSNLLGRKNVRCNAMCPGDVDNGLPANFVNEISSRIPMNRLAKADEYQGTLVWMLSDASSYLNGAIVPVEGGRTAW